MQSKKKAAIAWDDRCQQSFHDLKCSMHHSAPILAYADFTKPFKLHTNACGSGLGDVLYQTCDDGMDAIIAYASRSLTKGWNLNTLPTNWNFSPSNGL